MVRIRKPWPQGTQFKAQDLAMAMFRNLPCGVKWFWGRIGDIPYQRLLVMMFMLELDPMGETRGEL